MCPNYERRKTPYYCSICGESIYYGEEFVKNLDDEYAHFDCLTNMGYSRMFEWLGVKIENMENDL